MLCVNPPLFRSLLPDGCELWTVSREDEKILLLLEMKLTLKNAGCALHIRGVTVKLKKISWPSVFVHQSKYLPVTGERPPSHVARSVTVT